MLVNGKQMAAVAMVFLGVACAPAFATPVTFYFGGEITRAVDANGIFQGGIEVGDSFFGRYSFELEQPDMVPADPNYGDYLGAVRAVSVRVGDITLTSPFGSIAVANDQFAGNDLYQVAGPLLIGDQPFDFALTLLDLEGDIVDTDSLLAIPPSLVLSETRRFGFGEQVLGVSVRGDLQLLSIVPESATGVLALIGGLAVMLRRRKGAYTQQGVRVRSAVRPRAVWVAAVLGAAASSSFAAPVTFYFGGEITRADDPFAVLPVPIEVGNLFSGSYTFSPGISDLDSHPNYGFFPDPITAANLIVGDYSFAFGGTDGSAISTINDQPGLGNDAYNASHRMLLNGLGSVVAIQLSDVEGLMLESDALPLSPPGIDLAEFGRLGIVSQQSLGLSIEGTIQQFSNVPEPATAVLVLGGVLLVWRRKTVRAEQGVRVGSAVRPRAVWVAAVLGAAASSSYATPVTFYFGGEITRAVDANGIFQGGIEVGDSFFGRYTFELEQPDLVAADPNYGDYLGAVRAVSVRVGDITLTSPFGSIVIGNDRPLLGHDFYQVTGPLLFEDQPFDFVITLRDRDGEFVTSDALLEVPPSLALSEIDAFGIGSQASGVSVDGDLRFLSIVPEPATGVLALIGGMVVMLRRRSKGRPHERGV